MRIAVFQLSDDIRMALFSVSASCIRLFVDFDSMPTKISPHQQHLSICETLGDFRKVSMCSAILRYLLWPSEQCGHKIICHSDTAALQGFLPVMGTQASKGHSSPECDSDDLVDMTAIFGDDESGSERCSAITIGCKCWMLICNSIS